MKNEVLLNELIALEDKACKIGNEIQQLFFANERYFDRFDWAQCLDNVQISSQAELSRGFFDRKDAFNEELKWCKNFAQWLIDKTDAQGYGMGAAARGFDVTRPLGVLWTKAVDLKFVLNKIEDITKDK